jgi:hypothetical protein
MPAVEGWQSEMAAAQLQAMLLLGAKHWLFEVDAQDVERMEKAIDACRFGFSRFQVRTRGTASMCC